MRDAEGREIDSCPHASTQVGVKLSIVGRACAADIVNVAVTGGSDGEFAEDVSFVAVEPGDIMRVKAGR